MLAVAEALKAQRPNETTAELQTTIAETLKHAPKRKGGSQYKKPAEVRTYWKHAFECGILCFIQLHVSVLVCYILVSIYR